MADRKTLRIYLEDGFRQSAAKGEHNFINKIVAVVEKSRFRVEFCPSSDAERMKGRMRSGHSLTHMKDPPNARGLTFRRVYHYPFWQIEQTADRALWDVTLQEFVPKSVDADEAEQFFKAWRKRLFKDTWRTATRDGPVLAPLQGRLLDQRTGRIATPVEMVEHCLAYLPGRQIVATLHPSERYSNAEISALEAFERTNRNFTIEIGQMERYLPHCEFVVTQTSSVAFNGYFFGKPALLYGDIDFHHIAVKAELDDLKGSFAQMSDHAPDYEKYVWWFWHRHCINAGRPEVEDKIAARLARYGWPL